MEGPTLTERRAPWAVITTIDDPWVTSEAAALQDAGGLVLRLSGHDMLERASLFRAFARELDFPGYFGHNWNALVDCLRDWHGPGHGDRDVAILIEDADGLLDVDYLGLFVSVLCQAAWHANLRLDADGVRDEDWQPFGLHFVLLSESTPPTAFAQAVAGGMDVVVDLSSGRLTVTLAEEEWPGSATS